MSRKLSMSEDLEYTGAAITTDGKEVTVLGAKKMKKNVVKEVTQEKIKEVNGEKAPMVEEKERQ